MKWSSSGTRRSRHDESHPARGAWIEISSKGWMVGKTKMVAPRKGCVD